MSNISVCGWCQTGHFDQCIKQIVYYDKVWTCNSEEYKVELKKKLKKLEKLNKAK